MTDQSPWLFPEDVETLTGKKRHSAQIRALKDMQTYTQTLITGKGLTAIQKEYGSIAA